MNDKGDFFAAENCDTQVVDVATFSKLSNYVLITSRIQMIKSK